MDLERTIMQAKHTSCLASWIHDFFHLLSFFDCYHFLVYEKAGVCRFATATSFLPTSNSSPVKVFKAPFTEINIFSVLQELEKLISEKYPSIWLKKGNWILQYICFSCLDLSSVVFFGSNQNKYVHLKFFQFIKL
jgi:hypothetical protein